MKYEIRQIDAWADGDGGWTYNETFRIGEYETNAENGKDAFLNAMHKFGFAAKRGMCRVEFDGDIYELVNRSTGEPLLCAVPMR